MATDSAWGWFGLCFRAMNTQVEIQLYARTDEVERNGRFVLAGVHRMFLQAETCMTRFDPSSELSQLNRSAGRARRVSPPLYDVIEAAVWAAAATGSLFDPALLNVMETAGYDRSFEQVEQPPCNNPLAPSTTGDCATTGDYRRGLPQALAGVSGAHEMRQRMEYAEQSKGRSQAIGLNRTRREITLPLGAELDLGGIGKGWTVDRAADWLAGLGPFLVNAGGDLYAYGAPPDQPGWSIGIMDPWQPESDIARVEISQRALATSTISRRRWQRGGRPMHHLIDPRTGQPAETDVVSVTVIAQRTALAEIYAKVALIMGVEAGRAWLEGIPDVEGLLVRSDGRLLTTNGFATYMDMTYDYSSVS